MVKRHDVLGKGVEQGCFFSSFSLANNYVDNHEMKDCCEFRIEKVDIVAVTKFGDIVEKVNDRKCYWKTLIGRLIFR